MFKADVERDNSKEELSYESSRARFASLKWSFTAPSASASAADSGGSAVCVKPRGSSNDEDEYSEALLGIDEEGWFPLRIRASGYEADVTS